MTKKSPLPPSLSHVELPGGKTKVLNVRQIRRINRYPNESDDESATETNSDTDDWLHWNGDLDDPNFNESDGEADDEFVMDVVGDFDVNEEVEELDVHAAPNIAGLIRPLRKSKLTTTLIIKQSAPVNTKETRKVKGNKQR